MRTNGRDLGFCLMSPDRKWMWGGLVFWLLKDELPMGTFAHYATREEAVRAGKVIRKKSGDKTVVVRIGLGNA
jgi:hypothetical protein